MIKPGTESREFLFQEDVISELLPTLGKEQWQILFTTDDNETQRFSIWCALLDDQMAEHALSQDSWDLSIGDGRPGFAQSMSNDEWITTYFRFDSSDGIRPLVLYRSFHGSFPKYCELDEEFRLYHDLAEDKQRSVLLDFDSSGREIEVARISPQLVTAQLKYLRQFQAGTRLHLAIYIDSCRYSNIPLEQIAEEDRKTVLVNETARWRRDIFKPSFSMNEHATLSRLLGKVVLSPPPMDRAGIWPFESKDDKREVSFIIGIDENGNPAEHSSESDQLSNNFSKSPKAPHYLTPVFFRREVLSKYFSEPDRYEVKDGQLHCLSLWCCQIDNDLDSYVVVFLGDLGRDLPYEERLHWRQFNVPPQGGVSETNYRRSFLAQFTEPQSPDLVFRREYSHFNSDWEKEFGWPIFLSLTSGDSHMISTIRIPVTNSQAEMDEQILHLTKLIVDSLNEKELAARAGELPKGAKGIKKLEAFFIKTGFAEGNSIIGFLRDLQSLRSTGSGHLKGSSYEKIIAEIGADTARKPEAVSRLLEEATAMLLALRSYYLEQNQE